MLNEKIKKKHPANGTYYLVRHLPTFFLIVSYSVLFNYILFRRSCRTPAEFFEDPPCVFVQYKAIEFLYPHLPGSPPLKLKIRQR